MTDYFELLFLSLEQSFLTFGGTSFTLEYQDDKFDVFDIQEVCELLKSKYSYLINDFSITINNERKEYSIKFLTICLSK